MADSGSVVVKSNLLYKFVGIVGFLIFGFPTVLNLINQAPFENILIPLSIAGLCLLLWFLSNSYILIDNQKISVTVIYGRFQIRWDEITLVTTNNTWYCFSNLNKRVVISLDAKNRGCWRAKEFITNQCKLKNLEIEFSLNTPLTHLNSRV